MSVYPQKHWKKILNAGTLDELVISYYAPTEEIYNQLQPPLDYKQTEDNIKRLTKYKHRLRWNTPLIKLEYLVTPETWPVPIKFYKKWVSIVDQIALVPLDNWGGNVPIDSQFLQSVFGMPQPRVRCNRIFNAMNIHFDGSVNMCCLDYNDDYVIGNVFEDGWNVWFTSEKMNGLRQLHAEGRWDEIPMCKQCLAYKYNMPKEWVEKWLTKPSTVSSVINP